MAESCQADRLLLEIFEKDTNRRLQAGSAIQAYFNEEENSVHDFDDHDRLIAGLVTWINSSHPKICTNGIETISTLALVLGEKFKTHLSAVVPPLRERLGDVRQPVREAAMECLLQLMDAVGSPQIVMDKLLPDALTHKGWHVREQALITISQALERLGSKNLLVGRYMRAICKLTADANFQVRDQAIAVIVDVYRQVGDRLRGDLVKNGLPQARLDLLFSKFDEIQLSGSSSASGGIASGGSASGGSASGSSMAHSATAGEPADTSSEASALAEKFSSMSMSRSGSFNSDVSEAESKSRPLSRPGSRQNSSSNIRAMSQQRSGSSLAGAAESGAVDEDEFEKGFDDFTSVLASSPKEIDEELVKLEETLSNPALEWEVRIAVLKRMRGLLNNGAADMDVFQSHLSTMRAPFAAAIKDLRSTVVKEACITVALMARKLEIRLDNFCEWVIPPLLLLVPNSVKIMATSAHVCIGFITMHVHSHRLIPLFAAQNASKSATVRKHIAEYIEQMLLRWHRHPLEKQIKHLEDCLKNGINDADSGTRTFARQAYWAFANHFPTQAEKIKSSLEPSRQRMLTSEQSSKTPSRIQKTGVPKSSLLPPGSLAGSRRFTSEPDLSPSTCRRGEVSGTSRSRITPAETASNRSGMYARPVRTATAGASTANSTVSPAPGASGQRHMGHLRGPVRPASTTPGRSKPMTKLQPVAKTPGRLEGRHASESAPPTTSVASPSPYDFDPDENMVADDLLAGSGGFGSENLPLFPGGFKASADMDDDNISIASDISTASTASNFSIQSMSGRLHIVEDVPEILRLCQSSMWSDRRDGLASLGQLLQSPRSLLKNEVHRFQEVFFKLFNDPHNTVLGVFLDVLMDFVLIYRADLRSWLHALFQRVFAKLGTELRSSIGHRMRHLQDVIRESFDANVQLPALCKILNDQSQPHHLKVKLSLLKYLHQLVTTMEATDFVNTSDVRQGVAKIAGMANEPKSVDVRKTAAYVLLGLHTLNEEVFMKIISAQPRNFRDSTLVIVHEAAKNPKAPSTPHSPHHRSSLGSHLSPPSAGSSPVKRSSLSTTSTSSSNLHSASLYSSSTPDLTRSAAGRRYGTTARVSPTTGITNRSTPVKRKPATTTSFTPTSATPSGSRTLPRKSTLAAQARAQAPAKTRSGSTSSTPLAHVVHNQHADSTAGQHGGTSLSAEVATPVGGGEENVVTPQAANQRAVASVGTVHRGALDLSTPVATNGHDLADELTPNSEENYGTGVADEACLSLCVDDDPSSSVPQLLDALSATDNVPACLHALESLGELAIEDDVSLWDVHFSAILEKDQLLFDIDQVEIRVAALRFFRQLICFQPTRFDEDCADMCIAKLLQSYVDPSDDVKRQVEDMIPAVAAALPVSAVVKSVLPVISNHESRAVVCCLKLLTKIAPRISAEEMNGLLPTLVPPLVVNYAHQESNVRKASVFCLVALHGVVKDSLLNHLKSLTGSQMRLLTMYIGRAKNSH